MNADQTTGDHFICADCKGEIHTFPPRNPPPTLCAVCAFIAEYIENPAERDRLRRRL
jgi:hypothetical protein